MAEISRRFSLSPQRRNALEQDTGHSLEWTGHPGPGLWSPFPGQQRPPCPLVVPAALTRVLPWDTRHYASSMGPIALLPLVTEPVPVVKGEEIKIERKQRCCPVELKAPESTSDSEVICKPRAV